MLLFTSIWLFSLETEEGCYEQLAVIGHSMVLKMNALPPAFSYFT